MLSKPSKTIQSLTPLRGLAALLVMVHHYVVVLVPKFGGTLAARTAFFANGYLAVDFFFVLSGFILAHLYTATFSQQVSLRDFSQFIASRWARIYPLHIAMLGAFVILELGRLWAFHQGLNFGFVDGLGEHRPFSGYTSLSALLKNIFLVHSLTISSQATSWNHPAWSIGTEWQIYLICPWLIYGSYQIRGYLKGSMLAVWAMLVCAVTALAWLSMQTSWQLDLAGFHGLLRCGLECLVGIGLYSFFQQGVGAAFLRHDAVFVVAGVALTVMMHQNFHDMFAIFAIALLLMAAVNTNPRSVITRALNCRLLRWLGEISYAIYMVHIFISTLLTSAWYATFGECIDTQLGTLQSATVLLGCVVASVAVAHIVHVKLEQPLRETLRRMFAGRVSECLRLFRYSS